MVEVFNNSIVSIDNNNESNIQIDHIFKWND